MPDIEFNLKTKSDTAGAEQTADALAKITDESKTLGGALDESSSSLDKNKEAAAALAKEVGVVSVSAEEAARAIADVGKSAEQTAPKVDTAGEAASHSGQKHMALRRIMGELDRISPGLGEAMHLLAESYLTAGEAAEGGAVGVAEFTVALEEMLVTLGPLIIAMLAIQATFQYWDMYKEKVNGAAEAQAEATKKIVASTHEALKAVQELDEAMHPKKHDTAEKDEADLKQREQNLENAYNRQHELNKANEEKETEGAGSSEEKEAIRKHYEVYDAQLTDWHDKQKAAIEGTMEKQLQDLKTANDKLVEKSAKEFQVAKDARGTTSQDETQNKYDATKAELEKNAAEAKALREKLDDLTGEQRTDAGNAAFNSETNRQRFGVGGVNYQAPHAGYTVPGPDLQQDDAANKFAAGTSIADAATRGGKVSDEQKQFLIVLEQTITGHALTFEQAVKIIEGNKKNTDRAVSILEGHQRDNAALDARLSELESRVGQVRAAQNAGT